MSIANEKQKHKGFFVDLESFDYEINYQNNLHETKQLNLLIDQLYNKVKFWQQELGISFINKVKIDIINQIGSQDNYEYIMILYNNNKSNEKLESAVWFDSWNTQLPTFNFETNLLKWKQQLKPHQIDVKIKWEPKKGYGFDRYFVFNSEKFNDKINWDYFEFNWSDLKQPEIGFTHHYASSFVNALPAYQEVFNETITNMTYEIKNQIDNSNNINDLITIDPDFNNKKFYYQLNQRDLWYDPDDLEPLNIGPCAFDIYYQFLLKNSKIKCHFPIANVAYNQKWKTIDRSYSHWNKIKNLVKHLVELDQKNLINFGKNQNQYCFLIVWINDTIYHSNTAPTNKANLYINFIDQNQQLISKYNIDWNLEPWFAQIAKLIKDQEDSKQQKLNHFK